MKTVKILLYTLAIILGGFMFVYAEIDDSPGGQLIGVIFIIFGIVSLVKKKYKS